MISVIVPVYNVEPYLHKCLDSIINQTYSDLEILVVDDGSTDRSGEICDEYVKQDERIQVFHTENKGLSAARNLGLGRATGDWVGFVDSDDWIEPDMYELLLKRAIETEADVVECSFCMVYPKQMIIKKKEELDITGDDCIRALLQEKISGVVWNKLWNRDCFIHQRFPVGRIYEDIATVYLILYNIKRISIISAIKYSYLVRDESLSRKIDIENLIGYWRSHKERFDFLKCKYPDLTNLELKSCARAVARTWAHYYDCDNAKRKLYNDDLHDMNTFAKEQIPLFGKSDWKLWMRVGVFFPHFDNIVS